jgi:GGDEF domain-containing protein
MATWFGGLGYGGGTAFLAIVAWTLSNLAFPTHKDLPRAVMLVWGVTEKAIFFALVTYAVWKLHSLLDREQRRAMTDFVTGLPNRRAFASAIGKTIAEARPFSLAFMELDGLEDIYLDRGELFVDRLLSEMAAVCRSLVQGYRYSDQRFAALFPETSGPTAVKRMAELMSVLDRDVLEARGLNLRFKVGIAYCQTASQVSTPHLIRFLAGSMIFLRGKDGDQLEFFQFN